MDFWFHVRHIREEVVVTVNNTGSLVMQKAQYEEVTNFAGRELESSCQWGFLST